MAFVVVLRPHGHPHLAHDRARSTDCRGCCITRGVEIAAEDVGAPAAPVRHRRPRGVDGEHLQAVLGQQHGVLHLRPVAGRVPGEGLAGPDRVVGDVGRPRVTAGITGHATLVVAAPLVGIETVRPVRPAAGPEDRGQRRARHQRVEVGRLDPEDPPLGVLFRRGRRREGDRAADVDDQTRGGGRRRRPGRVGRVGPRWAADGGHRYASRRRPAPPAARRPTGRSRPRPRRPRPARGAAAGRGRAPASTRPPSRPPGRRSVRSRRAAAGPGGGAARRPRRPRSGCPQPPGGAAAGPRAPPGHPRRSGSSSPISRSTSLSVASTVSPARSTTAATMGGAARLTWLRAPSRYQPRAVAEVSTIRSAPRRSSSSSRRARFTPRSGRGSEPVGPGPDAGAA